MALGTIAALAAGGLSLLGSGISSYLNWQRNKTLDEREDTSIQRRMEDLRKSGLNPYLALGQGAGASQGIGMNFDTSQAGNFMQTLYETKNNRETYKQNQLYTKLMENELFNSNVDMFLNKKMLQAQTGFDIGSSRPSYSALGNLKRGLDSLNVCEDKLLSDKFLNSIKNEADYNYNQSMFNLKTQNYMNGLNLADDTIGLLADTSQILNPIGNVIRSIRGNRNYNFNDSTYRGYTENHNFNYRRR